MAKLTTLLFVLLMFGFSRLCLGEELIFPFTVDQQTKSEDMRQIRVEKDIQTDKWFMSPPTRLELLTYAIDQNLKRDFAETWELYKPKLEKYFEPFQVLPSFVRARAMVQFNSDMDIFYGGINIEGLGKPKKPMKEVCSEILNSSIFHVLRGSGFTYQNTFLSTFMQGSYLDPELLRIIEKLRKNFLLSVTLEASFDQEKGQYPHDTYIMQCYKLGEEKEVHYNKRTLRVKP